MWQSPFNTVRSIQDSFEAFLESDEFLVELERWQGFSTEDPSVLDIVGMWLGQGENILLLESFDMLLLLVINLVEDWAGSGKTAVGGMPLWPDVAGSRTPKVVKHLWGSTSTSEESDDELDITVGASHALLLRQNFEAQRASALDRRHVRIEGKIDRLTKLIEDRHK